jgi:sn-glycerol 3-phosphate transport system substrate-binding protein
VPDPATARPIVVDVWLSDHPLPGFNDPVVAAAESFNQAHPEYEIRTRPVFFADLPREVVQAVEQGNPPDLVDYYFSATQLARDTRAADGGPLFTSVQQAIGGRTEILGEPVVVDDIVPAVRDFYSVGDDLMSLPILTTSVVMFGNQDLLGRAGVRRMPTTWAELETACAAVAALPDGPRAAASWPSHGWLMQIELAGMGGLLADQDNGRSGRATTVTLHSEEMLEYVRWCLRLRDSGRYLYTGEPADWLAGMEAFQRQEVALVAGSSAASLFFEHMAAEEGFELTSGPLPFNSGRPFSGRSLGGQSVFLTAGLPTEKEDGALAFLQHLLDPHNALARQRGGSGPVTVSAEKFAAEQGWYDEHPALRTAADQIASGDRSPAAIGAMVGDQTGISRVLMAAFHDVLAEGADPETRFRAATEEGQALLDAYNDACLADPPRTPDALDVL